MTVSQTVIAGSALVVVLLVVVLLVVVVARLSGRLSQVSQQLNDLQAAREPVVPSAAPTAEKLPVGTSPAVEPLQAQTPVPGNETDAEDVDVITRLDVDIDHEPTTARIASVTLGGPLIKAAAFSHGVRRALSEEHRMRIAWVVRKEMRRERKIRRRRRTERAPSQGWRP